MNNRTDPETFGLALADVVIRAGHSTYNARRGKKIVESCIKSLQERLSEIQPKKATPAYKKARYGKKTKRK
jgi:hypothetical protein